MAIKERQHINRLIMVVTIVCSMLSYGLVSTAEAAPKYELGARLDISTFYIYF